MRRIIAFFVLFSIILSLFPVMSTVVFAKNSPIFLTSFEGSWHTSDWQDYSSDKFAEGKLGYSNNTDKTYVTDGKQSLHLIDKDSTTYFGMLSPWLDIDDFGVYTLTADAIALSGSVSLYIRCYYSNKTDYEQYRVSVASGKPMQSYSVSGAITPETPYVRVLIFTGTAVCNEEAYIDNIKLQKTGTYDGADLHNKESVNTKLASIKAGSVIEIPDGTYSDWQISISKNGTAAQPITIKAKNPGKVIFTGESSITVSGDYVNIEGIRFEEVTTPVRIVVFDANSYGCSIRNCAIYNCHPGDAPDTEKQFWVSLYGLKTTVEDCFFYGKHSVGQMVEMTKGSTTLGTPDEHIVRNCYFGNTTEQTGNGYEAIRMGSSTYCFENSKTIVEGCFFEKCDGEGEIISVKSCENIVRNNTIYNSNGAIVLRHGNRNDIYGNLFVGGVNKKRVSGVRIIGEDHKVHDNYFYNMPRSSQVLVFFNGNPYEGIENHWYFPVKNAKVYNNTFIGGDRVVTIGGYAPNETASSNRTMAPEGSFTNNALVSYTGTYSMFTNGDPAPDLNISDSTAYHKVTFSGNIAYGKKLGYKPEGINEGYFELKEDGKYFAAPSGKGANLEEVKKAPTSPFEVITDWVREVYYDTGLVTFAPVEKDVFNYEGAHINDIIPFEVTYTAGEGGNLTLKENGTAVSGKTSFLENPELIFTAIPDRYKKISSWYVNGVEVKESNIDTLGIEIEYPTSETLKITNLTKKFDVEVKFVDSFTIPENITAPVVSFGGENERISFVNQEGVRMTISGYYKLFITKLEVLPYTHIKEYGFKISDQSNNEIKAEALVPLSNSGAYGVVFYGMTKGKEYSVYPYAVYELENGAEQIITGDIENFICQ